MKNLLFPVLFAGVTLFAAPVQAQQKAASGVSAKAAKGSEAYAVQPQLSKLGWVGKKVGGQHNGSIALKSGSVLVRNNQISGGSFVVDMNSLKNEDLTDADYNAKLIGHLRSDDFFAVDKNPTATFVITSVKPIKDAAGNNAQITGNLTIKGKTNPLSFPAKVGVKNGVASASGVATIDRTKYDVKYGSTLFGAAADKAIDDTFTLSFNVIAKANGVAAR